MRVQASCAGEVDVIRRNSTGHGNQTSDGRLGRLGVIRLEEKNFKQETMLNFVYRHVGTVGSSRAWCILQFYINISFTALSFHVSTGSDSTKNKPWYLGCQRQNYWHPFVQIMCAMTDTSRLNVAMLHSLFVCFICFLPIKKY